MATIRARQMALLNTDWRARLEAAVVVRLRQRIAAMPDRPEHAAHKSASDDDLRRYVAGIADRAVPHGFRDEDSLGLLVDACVAHGARELLSDPVLRHPVLALHEKVEVMVELRRQELKRERARSQG